MTTVGYMIASGALCRWKCVECGQWGDVDVQAIAATLGVEATLRDQHPRCRTSSCLGRVTFHVGLGMRWEVQTSKAADDRALIAAGYPERPTLQAHGWRIAGGLWRPPMVKGLRS